MKKEAKNNKLAWVNRIVGLLGSPGFTSCLYVIIGMGVAGQVGI